MDKLDELYSAGAFAISAAKAIVEAIGDKLEYYDLSQRSHMEVVATLREMAQTCVTDIEKKYDALFCYAFELEKRADYGKTG